MNTRKFFSGLTAVLLSIGFLLAGCEGPTGADGAGGGGGPGTVYLSGSVTSAGIQAAIDSGAPLVFAGVQQTTVSGADTIVIPKGRNVKLVGTPAYTTIAGAAGILVVEDAGSVDATKGTLVGTSGSIIAPQSVLARASGGDLVPIVDVSTITDGEIPSASIVSNKAALSGNVTVIADGDTPTAGQIKDGQFANNTVYVFGNVTVSKTLTTTVGIIASGDVTQAAAISAGALSVKGNYTSSVTGGASVAGLLNVGGNATFSGAAAQLGADTTVTGNLTASGGTGLTAGSAAKIKVGGNLSVTKDLVLSTVTTDALIVGGTANIGGNITTGSGISAIGFGGDVTLGASTLITATGADVITLAAGKAIKVGADSVLKAGTGAPAVLTFVDIGTLQAAVKKITTGGAIFTVTSGELIVAAGATLELGKFTNVVTGKLTLEDTAVLALPATGSTAKLTLGDTTVAGATAAATFTASGGSVTLAPNAITGSGSAPKLAIAGDDATISLDLAAANTKVLTLTSVNIDLTAKGILVVGDAGGAGSPNTVILKGGAIPGKITLGAGTTPITGTSNWNYITDTSHTVTLSGTAPLATGAADSNSAAVGAVGGGATVTTNDLTIAGQTNSNDVSLKTGVTFASVSG